MDTARMLKLILNGFRFHRTGYIPVEMVRSEIRMTTKNVDIFYRVLSDLMASGRVERSIINCVTCYRLNA